MFGKWGTRRMQKIDQTPKTGSAWWVRPTDSWPSEQPKSQKLLIYRFQVFCSHYKKKEISCNNRKSLASITELQTERPKLLSLSPVSLNKAFIRRFYCFLFVSQYVIKAGLHSDAAVSLMSLPGPLTAAQYNISGLRRYPHSPWIIQACTAASRTLFGKSSNEKSYKMPQWSLVLKTKTKKNRI